MYEVIYSRILGIVSKNFWSQSLTWSRVFFAVSTLLNLVFNSNKTLVINSNRIYNIKDPEYYSIYNILDPFFGKIISIIILISVIIGYFPKITSILHFWVAYSFNVSAKMIEGGDQVVMIYTMLLIPLMLLDKRKNHWTSNKAHSYSFQQKTIGFCTVLLMKTQCFVIYFVAAVSKFSHNEWRNGTAIYYWFYDEVFGLNETMLCIITPFLKNSYFIVIMTWGTLLLELLLAYSAFSRSSIYRIICYFCGALFHLAIAGFLGLWSFFFAMLGVLTYILLDLDKVKFYYEKILSKL